MELEQPINAYVCQYCKGSFDKLENLNKHVQKIHTVSSSEKENRICPLCGTQCIKIGGYRNHLRHIHGHNEEGQVVIFKSFNDFLVWKNELEKRNYCKYVMRDPPKKLPSKDKIHIYRCDSSAGSMKEKRSGVAVKESCPAVITAIESVKTKGVKIEHWNSHVGHIIPVEEDELDAAIGSLGTTEIVLTSDQRYQYEGQSADGNIFFITESNDGSLTETFARESPKKSSNLFQNKKAKVSDSFSKPASQKFSYKKDPTKKSGSFNYSLASVACMKPSAKKKILSQPDANPCVTTTTCDTDCVTTSITTSDIMLPTTASSVASSEIELATKSIIDEINAAISSKNDTLIKSKEKKTPAALAPPSKSISLTNSNTSANQTFEFINDGSLSGQVVLLNSLTGQNGNQNVLLSSDQKFISIGPAISVETVTPMKGKASKKSQKNNAASQIIVIPTTSEKENVSSVQNVLDISQNPVPFDSIVRSPGPSILKRAKKSVQKSPKKSEISTGKNITFEKTIQWEKLTCSRKKPAIQMMRLGCDTNEVLNPSLDLTVKKDVEYVQRATSNLTENDKVADSEPLEVNIPTPNSSSTSINFVPSIQDTVIASSPIIANSSVPTTVLSSVQSSVSAGDQNFPSTTVQNSVSTSIQNSVSTSIQNSVSTAIQNSISSAIQNSVSTAIPSSVPSSIPNIQPVNPILLNSFPPGQTFMSINNNLIPIGTPTTPLLPSNFRPGFVLTSPVPPSPVMRPAQPMLTYSSPRTDYYRSRIGRPRTGRPRMTYTRPRMTYSQLTTRPPGTAATTPVRFSDRNTQYNQTSIRTASPLKTPPHTSTVPLLLIPNSGSQISPSVPFSSHFVASNINSTVSSSIRKNITQPLISASGCSALPTSIISNNTPIYTQLPPGAQLIASSPIIPNIPAQFLSNNGQRISRPILQNVPLFTATGQQFSRSMVQNISFSAPLIGQPSAPPIAPRPIISTTVSNTIKVQKVQLPSSKTTVTSPSVSLTGIAGVTTILSEATKVSSVVLNTEPISSAPAISIPPLSSLGSQKNGSVIFETQGDVYMLEPVENLQINNNTSVKNVPNKVSIAVPSTNGNTKSNKSNEVKEPNFEGNRANLSSLQKEKAKGSQITLDTRVDGKIKSLSPRKTADIKNGVQIKSVVQEKRHLKDDDVEILKKVKYYQMEMKYLASQAECQRLKLELARAQVKNKEIIKNNTDSLSGKISMKGNEDEGALNFDVTLDKDNLGLKQTSCVENISMDVDIPGHEVADKTEDQAKDKIESTIQSETDSCNSNDGADLLAESGDSNYGDNCPVDSGDSNSNSSPPDSGVSNHNDIVDLSAKQDNDSLITKDSFENQNSNHDTGDTSCDIESDIGSNLETPKETCSALNEELQTINTLEKETNRFTPCDETSRSDSNEQLKDIDKSALLDKSFDKQYHKKDDELMDISEIEEACKSATEDNQTNLQLKDVDKSALLDKSFDKQFHKKNDELMDISEIEEACKSATEDNQTTNDSEIVDIFEVQESVEKQLHMSNKENSVQNNSLDDQEHLIEHNEICQQNVVNEQDAMDLDDHNNISFEREKINLPCDKSQFEETLKDLELQYGGEASSDIYTMIRTSVLRSLYDDMKTLCEENKKLYEKLQNSRSPEESCETDKHCS